MTRSEIVKLLIAHGWQMKIDSETGAATLFDEVCTDEHLLNMVKQYKKLPVSIVEE